MAREKDRKPMPASQRDYEKVVGTEHQKEPIKPIDESFTFKLFTTILLVILIIMTLVLIAWAINPEAFYAI